ncbi:MAG: hypothetical protein RL264_616 [Bacteroidota bacterium]|jgi:poly(hydroxyalkanoate) depolymerase family esterase
MKYSLFFLTIFCFSNYFGQIVLERFRDFGVNEADLRAYLFQPDSLKSDVPLVMVMHGCSQRAPQFAKESGWTELAKKYNFKVVFIEQPFTNNPSGCFNWFLTASRQREMTAILELRDYLIKEPHTDSSRVYLFGVSAGAMMAEALAFTEPDKFQGAAILAGAAMYQDDSTNWKFHILNKLDSTENFQLKAGFKGKVIPKIVILSGELDPVVPNKESFVLENQWRIINRLDATAKKTEANFIGNANVTRSYFLNARGKEVIVNYQFKKTGHVLPIDPGIKENQGGRTGLFSVDKDFFSTYYIAKDFGLIP